VIRAIFMLHVSGAVMRAIIPILYLVAAPLGAQATPRGGAPAERPLSVEGAQSLYDSAYFAWQRGDYPLALARTGAIANLSCGSLVD
jgi:hypothetical protein